MSEAERKKDREKKLMVAWTSRIVKSLRSAAWDIASGPALLGERVGKIIHDEMDLPESISKQDWEKFKTAVDREIER